MRRRLFGILSVISALLCIAMIVFWIRSYWVADYFWLTHRGGHIEYLQLSRGNVVCVIYRNRFLPSHARSLFWFEHDWVHAQHLGQSEAIAPGTSMLAGFRFGTHAAVQASPTADQNIDAFQATLLGIVAYDRQTRELRWGIRHRLFEMRATNGGWMCELGAPAWLLVVLTAILPVMQMRRFMRARRLRLAGHCLVCGYDLRATPDRCPECGSPSRSAQLEGAGI